jgi:hypothetical protein
VTGPSEHPWPPGQRAPSDVVAIARQLLGLWAWPDEEITTERLRGAVYSLAMFAAQQSERVDALERRLMRVQDAVDRVEKKLGTGS